MDKSISDLLFSENIKEELYFVGILDGSKCQSTRNFLKEIGRVFKFPSYYGQNLNALNDCLNDLEWLNKPNYILVVTNKDNFLLQETMETKNHILDFLNRVSDLWANVPNYQGEDEFRKKSDFRIVFL
jgi:RNAse (barnase) inhibitor barstar